MNYNEELKKVETLLRQEMLKEMGRSCGSILETALRDIYTRVLQKSARADRKRLMEVEEAQSKGKGDVGQFMLGQLVGLFREGDVLKLYETVFNRPLKRSRRFDLNFMLEIRNGCTHAEYVPMIDELNIFVSQVRMLLSETGLLEERSEKSKADTIESPKLSCSGCGSEVQSNWELCPYCGKALKLKCPGCQGRVEPNWILCPACGTKLKAEEDPAPANEEFIEEELLDTDRSPQFGDIEIEMVHIPGGEFMMGSDSDLASNDEKPVHRVWVSSFDIGKYPLTQGQWVAVMGSNPSMFKKGENYPVENVSWEDCQEFIKKLNRMTGETYRLPTEAEWEYAARGGSTNDRYGDVEDIAWYDNNSEGSTHPVGEKRANAYGLYDCLGNVWEWCQNWYGDYKTSCVSEASGPSSGDGRISRGGSWDDNIGDCRASSRGLGDPGIRINYLGFRLARGA